MTPMLSVGSETFSAPICIVAGVTDAPADGSEDTLDKVKVDGGPSGAPFTLLNARGRVSRPCYPFQRP